VEGPSLSEAQQAVSDHEFGPALVVSGAGSGKTHTLTSRICSLMYKGLARADQILALTFTRKAANEMRERVRARAPHAADDLVLSTFHSLALRLCREYPTLVGRQLRFSVWDERTSKQEMRRILRELWTEAGGEFVEESEDEADIDVGRQRPLSKTRPPTPSVLLGHIEVRREQNKDLDDEFFTGIHKVFYGGSRGEACCKAIREYEEVKRIGNALDYADLVFSAVRLLERYPEIREEVQKRWKFILVDEYQDTNNLQEYLLSLLIGDQKNLMAVGDEDQAIYGFRGSNVNHILTFPDRYDGCAVYTLGQNYRSQRRVVEAASKIVTHNSKRRVKEIWTENPIADNINFMTSANQFDEADAIAAAVEASINAGASLRDHAILVRTRRQFLPIQASLTKIGIPILTVGDLELHQRADIRLLLSWWRSIINPKDITAGAQCLAAWPKLGAALVEAWQRSLEGSEGGMFSRLHVLLGLPRCGAKTQKGQSLIRFGEIYRQLNDKISSGESIQAVAEWIYIVTGMDEELALMTSSGDDKQVEEAMSRVQLKETFLSMCPYDEYSDSTRMEAYDRFSGFVDDLLMRASEAREKTDRVTLTTVHSAKGLEWEKVWIAGCCDDLFPFRLDSDNGPQDAEEERRLMYVAVTRARMSLTLSNFEVGIPPHLRKENRETLSRMMEDQRRREEQDRKDGKTDRPPAQKRRAELRPYSESPFLAEIAFSKDECRENEAGDFYKRAMAIIDDIFLSPVMLRRAAVLRDYLLEAKRDGDIESLMIHARDAIDNLSNPIRPTVEPTDENVLPVIRIGRPSPARQPPPSSAPQDTAPLLPKIRISRSSST
jgi:DNA helicase-2/ATP-dependent DNA helicase PcrA